MFQELSAGASQRGFAEQGQLGQTLGFDGPYPAFSKGIQIRTAGWQQNWFDARTVKKCNRDGQFRFGDCGGNFTAVTPTLARMVPAISTLRVDRSMKNKTRKRFRPLAVHTSIVKKSAATISSP
jgi:hypothetical protein